jgi:hypothetical protein
MVVQKSKILDEVFSGVELIDKGKNIFPRVHDISFEKVSFAYEKKEHSCNE